MLAAVFEDFGKPLSVREVPKPEAHEHQIVVHVARAGICGTDLHLTGGPPGVSAGTILGHEFSGTVHAVGSSVSHFREGDRVCALPYIGCGTCAACLIDDEMACASLTMLGQGDGPGAYAEYVAVGAQETFALPKDLTFDDGALVEPLAVALQAVRAAQITPEDDVLVIGAGPIGLGAATWARHFGARQVIVSDLSRTRRQLALKFGAMRVASPEADLDDVLDTCCEGGPSVVIECVGLPGMLQDSMQLVRRRGRIVVAGACMRPDTFVPAMACLKELNLRFVMAYARADFELTLRLLAERRIHGAEMIAKTVTLTELPETFETLRADREIGKVLIAPGGRN